MKFEYAIVVKSRTRLEQLVERFNTKAQARFYLEQQGQNFEDYEEEHEVFYSSLNTVQSILTSHIKNKLLESKFVPSFQFDPSQLVVVIGQDGLVANTAKYVGNALVIPVNPDPQRIDGILLPHRPDTFGKILEQSLAFDVQFREYRFVQARLNDGQRLLGFNDLFIGATGHGSARYRISFNGVSENHSSSGIIISTQAGSTGWLSSVFNMYNGINHLLGLQQTVACPQLASDNLMFAVREPFLSKRTQAGICGGIMKPKQELVIESMMPSGGKIFSDGIESDYLEFNTGSVARITIANEAMRMLYSA